MSLKKIENPYIVENLFFKVNPEDVEKFLKFDYEVWTKKLSGFSFFLRKETWVSRDNPGEINTIVHWKDNSWRNINVKELIETAKQFSEKIGTETIKAFQKKYDENQYKIVNVWEKDGIDFEKMGNGDSLLNTLENKYAIEELIFKVNSEDIQKFIEIDYEIWTKELSKNISFIRKEVWLSETNPGEIKTVIYWDSYENWKSIDHDSLVETGKLFDEKMGETKYSFVGAPHDGNQLFKVNFVRK
ncbi:MAG: TIGR03792 family protein [Fusobacteriaceae bacterium]